METPPPRKEDSIILFSANSLSCETASGSSYSP
jgi:hypothetical protein